MNNNKYIFDWLRVTIKPDNNSVKPCLFSFHAVIDSLGLGSIWDNFVDVGSHDNYNHTFKYKGITIYATEYALMNEDERKAAAYKELKHFYDMGMNISFSGDGCRFYEALRGNSFKWVVFCQAVQAWQNSGCKINYCRIDFAKDDYSGLLNMDIISQYAMNGNYVSGLRTCITDTSLPCDIQKKLNKNGCGVTTYFGNRKSNTYVRFYDKRIEQLNKLKKGSSEYERIFSMPHWVRCEFVFRNSNANKIVAALLKTDDVQFSEFLSEVFNKYIRFTEENNLKTTRRTICSWWSEFIGTVKRSSLTCMPVVKSAFNAALRYIKNSVAPTLEAISQRVGDDILLSYIHSSSKPEYRFKQKHLDIVHEDLSFIEAQKSDVDMWELLTPIVIRERLQYAN